MKKEFVKGNDAVAKAAILAGCTHYFGYPITPSSEVVHAIANYFPKIGATFLQAESEVAAINMMYGAAAAGVRCMTASSSPGISLKQEGVSYMACAELPCVIVDVMRAGPGLGNIWPEQSDYNQVVKGGGHGNYKCIVLAPSSAQEMCDLTIKAFELADKYRTPVYLLADGYTGQVMEPVTFPTKVQHAEKKDWALYSNKESRHNVITSIAMNQQQMEDKNLHLQRKYKDIEKNEVLYTEYMMDDADFCVVSYGITSRITQTAIDEIRKKGMKIGLLKPLTLFPFPKEQLLKRADKVRAFTSIEMSNGQMLDDIKLAIDCKRPVEFYGRMGGAIPTVNEVANALEQFYKKHCL